MQGQEVEGSLSLGGDYFEILLSGLVELWEFGYFSQVTDMELL